MTRFYSNGKLLLSGEYVVLDGATALSLPTKFGQSLTVAPGAKNGISWKSKDEKGVTWFEEDFRFEGDEFSFGLEKPSSDSTQDHTATANKLGEILLAAHQMNPTVLSEKSGFQVVTRLDFKRDWGLGSSSTLVNNIAQWFGIDAFALVQRTFGGSGYDIASAQHRRPVTFTLTPTGRTILSTDFNPSFKAELFFVHLNKKQNSRNSITHYRQQPREQLSETIEKVSSITAQMVQCQTLMEFELLLHIHETLISGVLNTPRMKTQLFQDFPRTIKSLGGWGGDFILATGGAGERDYFREKGYSTIVEYSDMIL